ncbi:hypothetical protein LIER_10909 [Lithospermum erythrorhizon]|uniref:Integrase catalytic domain-containing protein n=1 Tax=Lithospermum erythrorhizon TaxID=34254 RepID=A0AAV3PL79_LITER
MQPPCEYKDIQKLTGCLAGLSRFISKLGERYLPFFKNLRRASNTKFYWDDDCKKSIEELKEYLGSPRLLSQPEAEETLHLYLAVSDEAVSSVLVQEVEDGQRPIYYVSQTPQVVSGLGDFEPGPNNPEWVLFVDGARNKKGSSTLIRGRDGVTRSMHCIWVKGTVDYFSKWVEVAPLKKTGSDSIVRSLWKHIVTRFEVPRILISDNGHNLKLKRWPNFVRSIIQNISFHLSIMHSVMVKLK